MVEQKIVNLDGRILWIECDSDMQLVGMTETGTAVEVRSDDLAIDELPDRIVLHSRRDLEITAPADTRAHIVRVGGDAAVRQWTGELVIDSVGGDLIIKQAGEVSIQNVGGDCTILDASGPVQVENVGSDFSGSGLAADVTVRHVGSDFRLTGATGNVTSSAGSDIRLSMAELSAQSVVLRAGSDVRVVLPPNPDVSVRVTSGGHTIKVHIGDTPERLHQGVYEAVFGSGTARLEITAGSDVSLSDGSGENGEARAGRGPWEDRIIQKAERGLRRAEQQLARAERLAARSSLHGQDAVRRAQERVKAALQRLEDRRQGRPIERDFSGIAAEPVGGYPSEPPTGQALGGATEEERMLILQMVQDKKITVEEADQLLSVLEGLQE